MIKLVGDSWLLLYVPRWACWACLAHLYNEWNDEGLDWPSLAVQTLQALADRRNKMALPALDKQKFGFRLPPPEDCLVAPNFQFHPRNAPEAMDWEDDPIPTGAKSCRLGNCVGHQEVVHASTCPYPEAILQSESSHWRMTLSLPQERSYVLGRWAGITVYARIQSLL